MVADAPSLADGTTFTHELTAAEVAGGRVAYSPDLLALDALIDGGGCVPLAGGGLARFDEDEEGHEVLAGPAGWLGSCGDGQLVGFRVAGGEVSVVPVGATSAPRDFAGRARQEFDRLNEGDRMPVPVDELIEAVVATYAGRSPLVLPPVGSLLAGAGFEVRGDQTGPVGTDWEAFDRVRAAAAVAVLNGLDPGQGHTLVLLAEFFHHFIQSEDGFEEADDGVRDELAVVLSDPDVGPAFVDVALLSGNDPELARFAGFVGSTARRGGRPGPTWLAAVAAQYAGDHGRADALFRKVLESHPDHAPSLEDAAWYASDRGDARRALDLLERLARLGDDEAGERADVLRPYAQRRRLVVGRNDPCPCRSGKKYKLCCLGAIGLPLLPDRVRWIWLKLEWFVSRCGRDGEIAELLDELGTGSPGDEPLAASLVLFLDGAVADFLAARGPLLPDDERNLVAQWALVDRSVFEVVKVNRGVGLLLRDIRTGDTIEVRERLGSSQALAGDLVCAHVVPDGVGHQIVGGALTVSLRLRDPLLAALDEEAGSGPVAAAIGAAYALPEVLTMEGEPVVLCEARYRLAEPAAAQALDTVLDRDGDETWSESTGVEGQAWVRGAASVEGEELVVSANSQARFERLCRVVEHAVPGLTLIATGATPWREVDASRRPPPIPPAGPLPPEAADALAAFVRAQEDRWVDEHVPALGGLTPRQAAADPTWREQLVALLHEFDRHQPPPGAATFDTGRLRAKLGLTSR